jgi:phospholipid/cholesterol/gamma-HCH transport system substrate-binding protein
MRRDDLAETALGLMVVAVAIGFFVFAAQRGAPGATAAGYPLHAAFPKADGVAPGTEVRLSGIKVGAVSDVQLLPAERNYWAKVAFTVRSDVKIPSDSTARITSDGLLGGAHVALEPGGAPDMLAEGGEIINTEGSADPFGLLAELLENMVSRLENNGQQETAAP